MADERDEIRSRIDLVELVGQRVALKRAGKHWKGLCPFHDDRNPSFYVNPDVGYYRCWSCGEKGDVFDWVMKTQNLEFREALETLAKQAGITLRPRTGEPTKGESEARAAAMDEANRFFRAELAKNTQAQTYCEGRGIDQDVCEMWELGYAPDVGEALAIHLQRKGHALGMCQTLFLVDQDAGGGFYDRFRGRLMFPIRDERGTLVAFGGRLLGDGHPKYVNSGDTPIYRKSRVLYGLHRAKTKLLETRRAVLVEGYLDVIACHRSGVEQAVASLGTSFAEDHARLLKRWCDDATVLYDGDEAGQKAAERACEILAAAGLRATVAQSPAGDDPDTLLRREGPLAVRQAVEAAVSPVEFSLRRLELRSDPATAEFWDSASSILATCQSPAEVDRHVTELAAKHMRGQTEAGARTTLYGWIKSHRRAIRKPGVAAVVQSVPGRNRLSAPEVILFCALLDESLRDRAFPIIEEEGLLWTEGAKSLGDALGRAFPTSIPSGPPRDWIGLIEPPELRAQLADIHFSAGHRISGKLIEEPTTADALEEAIAALRRHREERAIGKLKREISDDADLNSIMERLRGLKKEPV